MINHESTARAVTERIRALNDQLRTTLCGGMLVFTGGVIARGPEFQRRALGLLRTYAAFNADNDPYGEHDVGALGCDGEKLYFNIDYFDLSFNAGSPNPADQTITQRILTIMLADEY